MTVEIVTLDALTAQAHITEFAEILSDCVNGGAGVSFMAPFSVEDALAWWPGPFASVARGERILFGAKKSGKIVGTVQLILDTPPNQRHRADISKMLVHSHARKQGIGERLMLAAETQARANRRTLLTLDTVTGSASQRLYSRLGWSVAGSIPDYAYLPNGQLHPATFMWKSL